MTNTDLFRAAFSNHRDTLAASAERRIRATFAAAVSKLGPSLRGISNDWTFARVWTGTLSAVATTNGARVVDDLVWSLDESRLAAFVTKWADDEIEAAVAKLDAKIAGVVDVEVVSASGGAAWFVVVGKLADGRAVRVEQDQIVNVSKLGKLFNQWPARIYLDGKKTSEAAFARMVRA